MEVHVVLMHFIPCWVKCQNRWKHEMPKRIFILLEKVLLEIDLFSNSNGTVNTVELYVTKKRG